MWRSALFLLLASLAGAAEIEGRWRPVATSKGGIGAVLDFRAKGVLWVRTGAVVESVYAVEGNELVQPGPKVGSGPVRLVIDLREAGVLRLWQGQTMAMELRRVGEGGEGIVGEWVMDREMAGQKLKMQMIYRADGKSLLVMPFRSDRGTWRVNGENIAVTLPSGKRLVGAFTLSDGKLVLPEGREYLRF